MGTQSVQRRLGDPYWVHVTPRSSNRKTGPILVTTTSKNTCPSLCPFKGHGCYAEYGKLRLHWDKVSNRERGMPWTEFLKVIEGLPRDTLWRHNQAGDLPGNGVNIDAKALGSLVRSNKGKRGFTYTHYDVKDNLVNRHLVLQSNAKGFTVNVSATDMEHCDEILDTLSNSKKTGSPIPQIPVTCVLPGHLTGNYTLHTPGGRRVVVCPATYRDTSCAKCKLCQVRDRKVIVGFPAHGPGRKKVETPRVQGNSNGRIERQL